MKIAIDLNDVIRDFTRNFAITYVRNYNHEFALDELEVTTNELNLLFPFPSDAAYNNFVYEDYTWDLFAKCPLCSSKLNDYLNEWLEKTIKNIDTDEPIEVMLVSPMEIASSIGCTYSFISKTFLGIREVYLPTDSLTIWDRCDVLITANPYLLANKPSSKRSIKIVTDYNTDADADYTFTTLAQFLKDENNTLKLLEHEG